MSWLALLATLDGWTLARLIVAAGIHATALLAVGSVLFSHAFPSLPRPDRAFLHRTIIAATWSAILLLVLQWPLQAAYLGGDRLAASLDPLLLRIIAEGARGERLVLAVSGLVLLQAGLVAGYWRALHSGLQYGLRYGLGVAGIVLVLAAFARVGHTRGDLLLGGLLGLHLAMASFWLASLPPLHRLAGREADRDLSGRLLQRFGRLGVAMIALLLASGGGLAWLLLGGPSPLIGSPYGQMLLVKLALVGLLLSLGAFNKWRLVPAYVEAVPGASRRLRRHIALEGVLMVLVLLVVALWGLAMLPEPSD